MQYQTYKTCLKPNVDVWKLGKMYMFHSTDVTCQPMYQNVHTLCWRILHTIWMTNISLLPCWSCAISFYIKPESPSNRATKYHMLSLYLLKWQPKLAWVVNKLLPSKNVSSTAAYSQEQIQLYSVKPICQILQQFSDNAASFRIDREMQMMQFSNLCVAV